MTDDGWEKVATAPADDEWEQVPASERPAPVIGEALPEASAAIPEAFLHRLALGAMIGGSDPSPEELRAKGMEDFNLASNTASAFKAGLQRMKTGFSDTHSSLDLGMGAFQALTSPLSSVFQAIGGAGEKATGGILSGDQINTALMVAGEGSAPGTFSRVRGGLEQAIGTLPTPKDFAQAGKVLEGPRTEANLKQLWQEDGIHPAEAVHDASQDGFLAHEIKTGEEIKADDFDMSKEYWHGTTSGKFTEFKESTQDNDVLGPAVYLGASKEAAEFYGPGRGGDLLGPFHVRGNIVGENDLVLRDPDKNPDQMAKASQVMGTLRRDLNDDRFRPDWGKDLTPSQYAREFWQRRGVDGYDSGAEVAIYDPKNIRAGFSLDDSLAHGPVNTEEMDEAFGRGASLSAALTDPADIPLNVQPAKPAGSLIAKAKEAADNLFDVGRDIQMKLTPMARGSMESMATVKDYMNSMRRNAWDASRIDTDLMKNFTSEQRARMWTAMDEESTSLRLGEPASAREHQGLATLEPAERQAIIDLDNRQQLAWLRAKELGMVEGDGIVMHAPRMVINIPKGEGAEGAFSLDATGYDLRTRTPGMKQRKYMEVEETEKAAKAKYGEQAVVARDIRAVNLATSQLHDAIAGRTLIENIKDVGKRTQDETIAEGFQPDPTWFTIDHPAFKTWRPKLAQAEDGAMQAVKDAQGNPVFEQVPIYVRGDFEGPLRSAMWGKSGDAYQAVMSLKGKAMGAIMYSPMIHNMVELGRAFPALPTRIIKAYFDGYRAKNDPAVMHEAIDAGLVPIGKRFFNQDINSIMESPDLVPGRGWTAKLASAIPGLFDEAAGTAVKQAVDKMGDIYHNTLLWDRIADLQMGLYTNFRGDLMGSGMDRQAASRIAAHWANRYAGALPKEAMSEMATKVANFAFFSRSFTFGNLGVMKDMLTGLPKDVLAQIERDGRLRAGSIEGADVEAAGQQAVADAKGIARRKAISTVAFDIALQHAGNTMLQNAFNVMNGSSWSEEENGYLRRFQSVVNDVKGNPLELLNPVFVGGIPSRLDATADNEPGKGGRIMIGRAKDGTAIYARNPVGKIGEEFSGYFDGPLDMLRRKEGTVMRPLMQIYSNDAGFGRKIYDPNADTLSERAGAIGAMVKHLMTSQLPMQPMAAAHDLVTGEGDKFVNELQVAGPFAGVTFSKGAPGGPAVGEMYHNKSAMEFRVQQAMPNIRKQIQRGDVNGARQIMTQIGMDASYQNWTIKTSQNPSTRMSAKALGDFYRTAPQEAKDRMMRLQP